MVAHLVDGVDESRAKNKGGETARRSTQNGLDPPTPRLATPAQLGMPLPPLRPAETYGFDRLKSIASSPRRWTKVTPHRTVVH
jgi:hypothetical protein